jgi:hypothetical protein
VLLEDLQEAKKDPHNFIFERIGELKNEIDLMREESKLKIDDEANRIIEILVAYEAKCQANLTSVDFTKRTDSLDRLCKEISEDMVRWQAALGKFDSPKHVWMGIRNMGSLHCIDLKASLASFKNFLLLHQIDDYKLSMLVYYHWELSEPQSTNESI